MSRFEFESRPNPLYLQEPVKVSKSVTTVIGERGLHCDTATGVAIGIDKISAFIDVGSEPAHQYTLRNALATNRPFDSTVYLLSTHLDLDHFGGLMKMKTSLTKRGINSIILIPEGSENSNPRSYLYDGRKAPFFRSDGVLKDGDTLHFGETAVTTYSTPGHKEQHISFAVSDDDGVVLVAGDVMGMLFSERYTNIKYNLDQQNYSIGRLGTIRFEKAVRGHDNPYHPLTRTIWDRNAKNFAAATSDLRPGKGYVGKYGLNQQY